MRIILIFTVFFGLASIQSLAQISCGTDSYIQHLKSQSPYWLQVEQDCNDGMTEAGDEHFHQGITRSSSEYVIPCVVHIIHNNGPENIPDEQVMNCIDQLNDAFSNSGEYETVEGVSTGITFCLAQQDSEGEYTAGINRVESDLSTMLYPSQDMDLKSLINWDPNQYLNIWVVSSITGDPDETGVVGYATLPFAHGSPIDGVVCEAEYFGTTTTNSKVMAHELGHYCGLYHTFEGACPNDDCLTSGDRVCDTPPDQILFATTCESGTNSCYTDEDDISDNNPFRPISEGGLGDQEDDLANYLDYTGLECMEHFTPGQVERMCAMLELYRSSLFGGFQCYPPCDSPIELSFLVSDEVLFVGESFSIQNMSVGYTNIDWYLDEILITSMNDFSYDFTETGEYLITAELDNGDLTCIEYFNTVVTVECDVDLEFSVSPEVVGVNEEITVEYLGDEDNFEWIIDGEEAGSDGILELTYYEAAFHSVAIQVTTDLCTETSASVIVQIGACLAPKNGNIWYMYSGMNELKGFDFNSGELEILTGPFELTFESKTTWCDHNGNMLFTTDGLTVWGADESVLENGTGLMGNLSCRKGVGIMKAPGLNEFYYLITSDANENDNANGIRYSIIDAGENDGLGAVTTDKNILVGLNGREPITLAYHSNWEDFWIVTYNDIDNQFDAYLVDESGVASNATSSPFYFQIINSGLLEFSPQGNMMIFEDKLMHFDQSTGEFTLAYDFDQNQTSSYEFSPDGKQLYNCSSILGEDAFAFVQRWDISNPENAFLTNTTDLNFGEPLVTPLDCQLAPDGNIYILDPLSDSLTSIQNPNASEGPIILEVQTFPFTFETPEFGNNFHGHQVNLGVNILGPETVCIGQIVEYTVSGLNSIDEEVVWTVTGDVEILSNDGSLELAFNETGLVTIEVFATGECGTRTREMTIEIGPAFDLGLPDETFGCEGEDLVLQLSGNLSEIVWQDGSSSDAYTVNSEGLYSVEAQNAFGCIVTDLTEVIFESTEPIDLGQDVDICDGFAIVLEAGDDYQDYTWQDGSTNNSYTIAEGGTYYVTATIPCFSTDTVFVTVCDSTKLVLELDGIGIFSIFPNPTTSHLFIEGPEDNLDVIIQIYESRGRIVLEERGQLSQISPIDIKGLAEGIYHLRIIWNNKVQSQVMFKN